MHASHSLQLLPETRFAFRDKERIESSSHSPRQNRLLAALSPECYERLLPYLELVPLPLGWTLHYAGDLEKYLYFPTSGIVSRYHVTETGESTAFAITGNEGAIGVALFLGGISTPNHAEVLSAGYAYRLSADKLKSEFECIDTLRNVLLRYTMALITQTAQTAVCNRHHSVLQQFCRLLLACIDRVPSNELAMTQERIADMLGVRREAITETAGHLQKMGMIHHARGRIAVLDRPALEAQACECYAVVRSEIARLTSVG
jgi:CRP-like cAMP-binding protein